MIDIDISGLEDCVNKLTNLPPRVVKGAFGKALVAAALPIVEALEVRTPVDTGLLKSSIKSDVALNADGKGGKLAVGFGKQGFVARMVEYGHHAIGHKPDKTDSGKVVEPHAFMRPAAAVSADAATEAFKDSLLASLDAGDI